MLPAVASLTFQRENLFDIWDELLPLVEAHHAEVHTVDEPLDLDRHSYTALERAGVLFVVTCRVDGRLSGYSIHIVSASLRFKTHLEACHDSLYLAPEARGLTTLVDMVRTIDELLAAEGVRRVSQHVGITKPWGRVLKGLGYEAIETVYRKTLGGG